MATCMSAMTSDLYLHGRSDPEYYLPSHTEVEAKLNLLETVPLGRLGLFSCSAFYPAATQLYTENGMPFLRCVDIVDYPLISGDQPFARIPRSFVFSNSSIRSLSAVDIVISKVGTPCYASLLSEDMPEAAMTRTVLGMSNIKFDLVNPYYLIAFLRSRYGFDQLMRERELTIQYQLTLERTRKIRVYLPVRDVQDDIGNDVIAYYQALRNSAKAYKDAQHLLESELGLDKLKFKKPVGYTARFSELEQSRRTDSEFFNPELRHFWQKLSARFEMIPISKLAAILKFGNPSYGTGGMPIVTQKYLRSISPEGYGDELRTTVSWQQANPTAILRCNDLLFYSVGAYLGKTNLWLNSDTAVPASFITLLRCYNDNDAGFLHMVLNSRYGILQSKCFQSGTSQQYIYPKDIRKFLIPEVNEKLRKKLNELVSQSYEKGIESKRLLNQAKTRVEQLIEEAVAR